VSSALLLVGLLVLVYAGSFLASGRTLLYVLIGLALGPHLAGVLGQELVTTFEPLAQVSLGWLALVIGLDFGRINRKRATAGSMALGFANGAISGGAVTAAVWFFTTLVRHQPADLDHLVVAGGIGAALAETTRQAIRWVSEKHGATGKLTRLLSDCAHADDFVPLVAMAFLFSLEPVPLTRVVLAPWAWVGVTIGFGVALGAMTAMHIGRELRVDQTWGVLLGMSVLGLGVAARLGMSVLTVLFFMGWTTAALSQHRAALRAMVTPLERPIVLPALVLAGAHVDVRAMPGLVGIMSVAVATRIAAKMSFGAAIALPNGATPALGAGLLSSGALGVSVGLAFAIRFPGPVGEAVLATSVAACVVGELAGPFALRKVLERAGEIDTRATTVDATPPETMDPRPSHSPREPSQ
jgi:hypothetical protein